jgi:hypothetical protein
MLCSRQRHRPSTLRMVWCTDCHERHFGPARVKRTYGPIFWALFSVDRNSDFRTNTCDTSGGGITEKGVCLFSGRGNHRRLPHGQPDRLLDRGDVCCSPSAGPIKRHYLKTSATVIQARVATTTLPTNTSGKKKLHPMCQAASAGRSC